MFNKYLDKKYIEEIFLCVSVKSEEVLYVVVGFGDLSLISIFNKLMEKECCEKECVKVKVEVDEFINGGEIKIDKCDVFKVKSENGVII